MKIKTKTKEMHYPSILSRHPSHRVLRRNLSKMPFRSVIRFGSTIESSNKIQINTVEAIRNSASKLRMKKCFAKTGVKTADWIGEANAEAIKNWCKDKYPIIAKSLYGSRGKGNTKIDNKNQLENWMNGKNLSNYLYEMYNSGIREYRFHVSTLGVFLTWRKLRRNDTPKNERWFFNNHNCNWVSEKHELYNKPSTYNEICKECLKALNAVGLDFCACDVRVDKKGNFIIIEVNSAPAMAEVTTNAYKEELTKLLKSKMKL